MPKLNSQPIIVDCSVTRHRYLTPDKAFAGVRSEEGDVVFAFAP